MRGLRTPPLCDIPSGCCSFTGPWTVTRSSLRMLRRVATFCRPLRPVLLLVSFPRSRSPVVGMLGLCWLLPGSFDCFGCPRASVHRPSIACLAVFLCGPGAFLPRAPTPPRAPRTDATPAARVRPTDGRSAPAALPPSPPPGLARPPPPPRTATVCGCLEGGTSPPRGRRQNRRTSQP